MQAPLTRLDKCLTQRSRDHALLALGHVGQGVAHPMNATPLRRGANDPADRRFQPLLRVGDDKLHALETATNHALEEGRPEGLGFGWADVEPDDLALAVGVGGDSDYRRERDDATALALLEVGGVQSQIRSLAAKRAVKESADRVVDVFTAC